ncbi:hypothetical protein QJS66_11565 [Kocuria rhizophila]|nr:hypothetical protein QJS66_11565 [Kocuria rhizophila]
MTKAQIGYLVTDSATGHRGRRDRGSARCRAIQWPPFNAFRRTTPPAHRARHRRVASRSGAEALARRRPPPRRPRTRTRGPAPSAPCLRPVRPLDRPVQHVDLTRGPARRGPGSPPRPHLRWRDPLPTTM